MVPLSSNPSISPLALGQVSSQDILATRAVTYQSEVLTQEQRDLAAAQVLPVYAPPDASVARAQVQQMRSTMVYIDSVREDSFATEEQKVSDLAALQHIRFSASNAEKILELNPDGWKDIQQEAITVLEQVMRSTIREDRLEDARRSVPALVSLSLPEEHAALVSQLVAAFVAPNSIFSDSLTEARRQQAREDVAPISRAFILNETVVSRGEVITAADLEALEHLGLLSSTTTWQERVGVIALVAVCFAYIALYFVYRKDLLERPRTILIIAIFFLLFLFGARFTIPNRTVIPFLFPLAAYSILISALASARAARALALPMGILAGYGLAASFELTLYYSLTGIFGILALRNARRISNFFWAGVAISGAGMAVILAYRLTDPSADMLGIFTLLGASAINAFESISLAILLQYFLAQPLGSTTTLQLLELSRPDHPLLQFILRNAPGTYQHSLQIANLAEQAAELIAADALLTRIGALYHDCGKARHPHYFIENQVPGGHNPHEELSPKESSQILIRHVSDGAELAEKHRLPRRIKDFILEHHGTLITRYQYAKAVEAAGGDQSAVNKEDFRYGGPSPRSRETALVMLADGCEARTRAERPESREELRALVKDVVEKRLADGQLDNTELTMKDLHTVIDSFTTTLRGIYHPRIQYPKEEDTRPREPMIENQA